MSGGGSQQVLDMLEALSENQDATATLRVRGRMKRDVLVDSGHYEVAAALWSRWG